MRRIITVVRNLYTHALRVPAISFLFRLQHTSAGRPDTMPVWEPKPTDFQGICLRRRHQGNVGVTRIHRSGNRAARRT
jgi:hypothetical protein